MAHINGEGDGVGLVIDLAGLPLREHECASELVGFHTREFADQPVFNNFSKLFWAPAGFRSGLFRVCCVLRFGHKTYHLADRKT